MEYFSHPGRFRLWLYTASHNSLLIRGQGVEEDGSNIDIMFTGTFCVNTTTKFHHLRIETPTPEELAELERTYYSAYPDPSKVYFALDSGWNRSFIGAAHMRIERNQFGPGQNSLFDDPQTKRKDGDIDTSWRRTTRFMSRRLAQFETLGGDHPDGQLPQLIRDLKSLLRLVPILEAADDLVDLIPDFHHLVLDLIGDSASFTIGLRGPDKFEVRVEDSQIVQSFPNVEFSAISLLIADILADYAD